VFVPVLPLIDLYSDEDGAGGGSSAPSSHTATASVSMTFEGLVEAAFCSAEREGLLDQSVNAVTGPLRESTAFEHAPSAKDLVIAEEEEEGDEEGRGGLALSASVGGVGGGESALEQGPANFLLHVVGTRVFLPRRHNLSVRRDTPPSFVRC